MGGGGGGGGGERASDSYSVYPSACCVYMYKSFTIIILPIPTIVSIEETSWWAYLLIISLVQFVYKH